MVSSSAGERGWGRAERRRRWWSWVRVIVSSGGFGVEVLLAGGRRDRTDQVGLERSLVMSSLVWGEASGEGLGNSLIEGAVDSIAGVVVEL